MPAHLRLHVASLCVCCAGKTTLVDAMLKQAKVFRDNQSVEVSDRFQPAGSRATSQSCAASRKGQRRHAARLCQPEPAPSIPSPISFLTFLFPDAHHGLKRPGAGARHHHPVKGVPGVGAVWVGAALPVGQACRAARSRKQAALPACLAPQPRSIPPSRRLRRLYCVSRRTPPFGTRAPRSTSLTPPATPTSAERWSACSTWPTACCCWVRL